MVSKVTTEEMRGLLDQLRQEGQLLAVRKGYLVMLNPPRPELFPVIKRVLSNRRLAVRTLLATTCCQCGCKLMPYEVTGVPKCFHCWLSAT
jgi:hypothetical protein